MNTTKCSVNSTPGAWGGAPTVRPRQVGEVPGGQLLLPKGDAQDLGLGQGHGDPDLRLLVHGRLGVLGAVHDADGMASGTLVN